MIGNLGDLEFSAYLRSLVVGADTKIPLQNGQYVPAINFDNAATAPPLAAVLKAVADFAPWYSSIHRGKGYKSVVSSDFFEEGRATIKSYVNADTDDTVIYTKNTTEAINLLAHQYRQCSNDQIILTTEMEHLANDLPWREHFQLQYVKVDAAGRFSLDDLAEKLHRFHGRIALVTVAGASNVTGYINPVNQIAALAHQHGAKIHVDGAQWVPHAAVDMQERSRLEHIDFLTFSAHKMYAPFGSGVLIGPRSFFDQGKPLLCGGGAVELVTEDFIEWGNPPELHEAGTPNLMGVVALIAAIRTLQSVGMTRIHAYEMRLTNYLVRALQHIPGLQLYTQPNGPRVSMVSFNMEGMHHHILSRILSEEAGIAVRSGMFCAHPYAAKLLGLTVKDMETYRDNPEQPWPGLVRMSLGLYNTYEEINVCINLLDHIARNRQYYLNRYQHIPRQALARS